MAVACLCACLASGYAIAGPAFVQPAAPAMEAALLPPLQPFEATALPVTFSALERLQEAEVSRGRGRAGKPCPRQGRRHRCGGEPWNYVGPYAERAGGRAVRCIWLHPANDRLARHLTWHQVPIGARVRASLVLLSGAGRGKAVRAQVTVDQTVIARLEVSTETVPGQIDAAIGPGPPRADLVVRIDADNNHWRLACLSLQMLGHRPPAKLAPAPAVDRSGAGRLPSLRGLILPQPTTSDTGPGADRAHWD